MLRPNPRLILAGSGRVRRPCPNHRESAAKSPSPLANRGYRGVPMARQHGTRQPAPGHRDRTIRSPASYPTRAMARPSSEVGCRPAGAGKLRGRMLLSGLRPAPPTYDLPAHSGLDSKGPERMFTGAAAMKLWKTSSAANETRSACPCSRLNPQWSGYGLILPQRTSRKPETGPNASSSRKPETGPGPADPPSVLSLISPSSPKQLGMVSPELPTRQQVTLNGLRSRPEGNARAGDAPR